MGTGNYLKKRKLKPNISFFLYYYYPTPSEFFTPIGGFSLNSEWQQVFSGLQESSK